MNAVEEVHVELEVPFHDVDALHVVWHGHYYKYFEIARSALMRANGLDGEDFTATGYTPYVIESKCRHVAPLRYGERLRVTARFKDLDHRIHVAFEIRNLTQDCCAARGHTILATVDSQGRLQLETPSAVRERLPH